MISTEVVNRALDLLGFKFSRRLDAEARENYEAVLVDLLTLAQLDAAVKTALRGDRMPSPGDLLVLGLSVPKESGVLQFPERKASGE